MTIKTVHFFFQELPDGFLFIVVYTDMVHSYTCHMCRFMTTSMLRGKWKRGMKRKGNKSESLQEDHLEGVLNHKKKPNESL